MRQLAKEPELTKLSYPTTVEWATADKTWTKHLFVDTQGTFPSKFNTWETKTLEAELTRSDLIGWLRNPDRKSWSLCIPYDMGAVIKGCYPDFLVARKVHGSVVIDIVDPHLLSFEDAWYRAKGLAHYAATHADRFGRIELIRIEGDAIERLDLKDEETRQRVLAVTTNQHLRDIFDR